MQLRWLVSFHMCVSASVSALCIRSAASVNDMNGAVVETVCESVTLCTDTVPYKPAQAWVVE